MFRRLAVLILLVLTPAIAQAQTEIDPETGLPVGWEEYHGPQTDECNQTEMTVHWITDDSEATGSIDEPQVKKIRCELIQTPQGEVLVHITSYRCGMTHVVLTTNRTNLKEPWGEVVAYYPCWADTGGSPEPIYPVSSNASMCEDGGFYDLLALTEHDPPRDDAYALHVPENCWPNAVG